MTLLTTVLAMGLTACSGGGGGGSTTSNTDLTPPTTSVSFSQSAITNTTWSGQAALNEPGTGYITAVTAGSPAPTAAEIVADNNANKAGTGCSVSMPTADTTYSCTVTGLTEGASYDFYFVAKDTANNLQSDGTAAAQKVAGVATLDLTPPITDVAFSQSAITNTTWSGQAALNEAGTGYITAITAGSAAPTAAEIVADNNANKAGTGCSVSMPTAATTYSCTVTGLTEGASYDFYFVAKDTAGNLQSDAAAQKVAGVATLDLTPPTTDVPFSQSAITNTTWSGQASLNEPGTGYITAITAGSAAPTAAEIVADNNTNKVGTGCSVSMLVAATTYSCAVTGLTEGASYDFYFVAKDTAGNLQSDGTAAAQKVAGVATLDLTPPTTDVAFSQSAMTITTWSGQASLNEPGTGYITAVTAGSPAPTAAEIVADNSPNKAGTGCSVSMPDAATTYSCAVTGLTEAVSYDFYFVAEDTANNLQSDGTAAAQKVAGVIIEPTLATFFQPASVVVGQADFAGQLANQGGGTTASANTLNGPYGNPEVYNGALFIGDTQNNRVLIFNTVPTVNNQTADIALGQADFSSTGAGTDPSTPPYMHFPQTAVVDGRLFVVEYSNNRVLIWNTVPTSSTTPPDVVVGQTDMTSTAAACTQSGLDTPESIAVAGGKLIVTDGVNNRVLIWNTIPTSNGAAADIVLGQKNFTNCAPNDTSGTGAPDGGVYPEYYPASSTTLNWPSGVWSDGTRLVVLDKNNNRALIWNTFPTTSFQGADLVLGQSDFNHNFINDDNQDLAQDTTPTARTLNWPYDGVASNGKQLFIADTYNNRVLVWNTFPTTDFQPADAVLGQNSFTSSAYNDSDGNGTNGPNASAQTLYYPSGIKVAGPQLFVTDTYNNRVLIYP